ncbi:hypothetical protein ABE530_19410 [Brucella sp. TWI559]
MKEKEETFVKAEWMPGRALKAWLSENGQVIAEHIFPAEEAAGWDDAEAIEKACDWADPIVLDRSPNLTFEDARREVRKLVSMKSE